jgi:hypothetical protein
MNKHEAHDEQTVLTATGPNKFPTHTVGMVDKHELRSRVPDHLVLRCVVAEEVAHVHDDVHRALEFSWQMVKGLAVKNPSSPR